jgi:hypothetical protein
MVDAVYPLCKVSSQSARVLNDRECPAHDTTLSTSDYPVYYDAIYFPQFHPEVPEPPEPLSIFLLPALAVVFGVLEGVVPCEADCTTSVLCGICGCSCVVLFSFSSFH